jgi:hypothetical protein
MKYAIPFTFRIALLLIVSFGDLPVLFSQTDSISTDHSYLRIKVENDFFALGNWSDRYFSNGIRIEYQTPQG